MKMRTYQGLQDLHAMLDLLSLGRAAQNGAYYVHRGDLQWWLFYNDLPEDVWQSTIRLWEEDGRLIGWTLLSLEDNTMDVFVHPSLRGSDREQDMLAWALQNMPASEDMEMDWVDEHDEVRRWWLEANGFECDEEHFVHFTRSLAEPFDVPALPHGFSLRTSRGPEDARLRSVASQAAFGSRKPFEEYWPRTLRFMQSPVYVPEHEIFVISPEGEVASYCIIWTDEHNRLGHFEPVGTHPKFQRMGLGKVLLFDALRRLRREGMEFADVCTNSDNPAAIRLYESVGFKLDRHLFTFKKRN